jgi:hypothetical protein
VKTFAGEEAAVAFCSSMPSKARSGLSRRRAAEFEGVVGRRKTSVPSSSGHEFTRLREAVCLLDRIGGHVGAEGAIRKVYVTSFRNPGARATWCTTCAPGDSPLSKRASPYAAARPEGFLTANTPVAVA